MIYQNRAAANERLEDFELALQDLQTSIDLNNRSAFAFYFQQLFTEAYSDSFVVDPGMIADQAPVSDPPSSGSVP